MMVVYLRCAEDRYARHEDDNTPSYDFYQEISRRKPLPERARQFPPTWLMPLEATRLRAG